MTSWRSKATTTTCKVWGILVALLLMTGVASAGRKRIVVLDFEGDKAEKFHEDVVKLIKKSHTVVSIDKWNGTAEDMSATKLTSKNIKKVAKKLKVDGVVSGTVEKRRDEYILRMKLRSGASGELVGSQVNIKAEGARIDGNAARDIKDELVEAIAGLESNRGGGGGDDDDGDAKPAKGGKKPAGDDDDGDAKPAKGGKGFGKKPAGDDDDGDAKPSKGGGDDDNPLPKGKGGKRADGDDDGGGRKGRGKKVARKGGDDDDDGGEIEGGTEVSSGTGVMYSPGERAIDAALGLSFTGRRMSFAFDPNVVLARPAGYKQFVPVPGVFIDATLYPLAFGHKNQGMLRGLGVSVLFDRVLVLKSENPQGGGKLTSTEQRIGLAGVFRYPFGTSPTSPVIGGTLGFTKQKFAIDGMAAIPNVDYTMLEPGAFFRLPVSEQIVLNVDVGVALALGAGQIVTQEQYGTATITGFEIGLGGDYMLTKTIFARASTRLQTLGYAFKMNGMKSTGVSGARDTYFGGSLTAGFLF